MTNDKKIIQIIKTNKIKINILKIDKNKKSFKEFKNIKIYIYLRIKLKKRL